MEEAAAADLTWPHEGLKLFCNFSCDDMVPENGSTECWLGSHQETAAAQSRNAGPDSPEILTLDQLAEIRRQTDPPVQITVPKGAVAFRDLRVWHKGMPNSGTLPRHMISLGYGAERDPTAECSHLGAGKHKHLFGVDAKASFSRPPGKPVLVDTLASFVEGPVDHFGNPDPEGPSYTPRDANGVALTGPYKGTDFSGGRFQYWLPKDEDPVPLDQVAEEVRAGLPDWVHAVVSRDNSPEPGSLCALSLMFGGAGAGREPDADDAVCASGCG